LIDSIISQIPLDIPQREAVIYFVQDIIQQALSIYSEQVLQNLDAASYDDAHWNARVQHFIDTLGARPQAAACDHVLKWATFVVGSVSRLDEHKGFFEDFFQGCHMGGGFQNSLLAPGALRKIWDRQASENWTTLLAETRILVI
jgi:hypothetical protein